MKPCAAGSQMKLPDSALAWYSDLSYTDNFKYILDFYMIWEVKLLLNRIIV